MLSSLQTQDYRTINSMNTSIKESKSLPLPMSRFTLMGICTGLGNAFLLHFQKENPGACGAMPDSGSNLILTRRSCFPSAKKLHTWAMAVSHFQPKRSSQRQLYPCVSFHFISFHSCTTLWQHAPYVLDCTRQVHSIYRQEILWDMICCYDTTRLPGCVRPCRSRTALHYHLR